MRIFLLEDEFVLKEMIEEFLKNSGFEVVSCSDGERAREILYEERFDLLLLDVSVPHIDGFKLLAELRARKIDTPAIFITAKNDMASIKSGFRAGCDDYLKKPFELDELLLRVEAILKRGYHHIKNFIDITDELKFDISSEQLYKNGQKIELHPKELKALKVLLKNRGKVVSHDELISNIWGELESVDNQALRAQIKNLRKALGIDIIKNVRNEGYILE